MATVVPLRSLPLALVAAALALPTGACNRNEPPSQPPDDALSDGIVLRYAVPEASLQQDLALQLTRTRLGLYIEADLQARAELRLSERGSALETRWMVTDVSALTLDGTVEPDEADRVRALLETQGKGTMIGDAHGRLDGAATDADPVNVARVAALSDGQPPSVGGAILMTVLSEQLRLPRLPDTALVPGQPVEIEEESETVVTDADLVLPTTSVHRFTLRKVEPIANTRMAELDLVVASVAQPEVDPLLEPEDAKPAAELHSRAEGTLVFDLDRNLPVSMELSRTDSLRIGNQEVEQTLQVRTSFAFGG